MRIQTSFVRNYLSRPTNPFGIIAVVTVLSICLMMSLFFWDHSTLFSNSLSASYNSAVSSGEYWRLVTTSFIHGDLKHLLSNSLMLSFLVYFVTSFYGMFASLILSFLVSALTNYLVLNLYDPSTVLVGASGVVYYLWGFWMILYMFLQRQYSVMSRFLRMGTVFLILLVPTEFQENTSYLAHYIGFILGLIVGILFFLTNKKKLLAKELWEVKKVSDELTDLDIIALNYPLEE